MTRAAIAAGTHGDIHMTPYVKREGKWVQVSARRVNRSTKCDTWRARTSYRGYDQVLRDTSVRRSGYDEAQAALLAKVADLLNNQAGELKPSTPFPAACADWYAAFAADGRASARTIRDYKATMERYLTKDMPGVGLAGLTLEQANAPQRIDAWLRHVAATHGPGAATSAKTVLSNVLQRAVGFGVLPMNGSKSVTLPKVKPTTQRKAGKRDTTRALTQDERDAVLAFADAWATEEGLNPRTRRRRVTATDLAHFMAGTGVRVAEGRALRWEHLDLEQGVAYVHGTKTRAARRRLDLPPWLTERLRSRAQLVGTSGYVFAAPQNGGADREREWDQSNCAGSLAEVLSGAGFPWATPHTFRRTFATLAHRAGWHERDIADHLGHEDTTTTMTTYLGRDFEGNRSALVAGM